jgi:ABC-type transport system involved in cytochrome bd biosynthesis fused ATPase/permease subunit
MKNKLLFTVLTTAATLVVTHPTININLMPGAVIYTKSSNNNINDYCNLQRSFTDTKGLQVCEYKCQNEKRNTDKIIHTTSFNASRMCKEKIQSP